MQPAHKFKPSCKEAPRQTWYMDSPAIILQPSVLYGGEISVGATSRSGGAELPKTYWQHRLASRLGLQWPPAHSLWSSSPLS